jgi:2-polyprenyl-3-methyl-5-hydroxy-6-metoxy-1,4-benzoquinol methylase
MPSKFTYRSNESELLDEPNIPKELLYKNLRELDLINRTLGGHAISLSGIKELLSDKNKIYNIVDIGCGGGDAMKEIANWAKLHEYKVHLTGVDMNPDCIEYTKAACEEHSNIKGIVMDYRDYLKSNNDVDVIHCSLFCHHLKDHELVELFDHMNKYAKVGFVINDLQRHWFAYYSIKFLTRLLNGSALVKNDAPVSVLRGFRKNELEQLLQKANVRNAEVSWMWAFRYLVSSKKQYTIERK